MFSPSEYRMPLFAPLDASAYESADKPPRRIISPSRYADLEDSPNPWVAHVATMAGRLGITYMCATSDKRVRDSYTPEAKTKKPRKPRAPKATAPAKATKPKATKPKATPAITGREAYASMPTMETFATPKTAKRVIVPDARPPKVVTEGLGSYAKRKMSEADKARLRARRSMLSSAKTDFEKSLTAFNRGT